MQIRSAALTDIGKLRHANEDRFVCDDTLQLYGVADGIGGLPGGAEAAQIAITTLQAEIPSMPGVAAPDLVRLTRRINRAVCDFAVHFSPLGMGTTLTYGIIRDNCLHIAHVGDSRCCRLRGGKLTALTTDHTVENYVRQRRAAGDFVFFDEPHRKSLTRCIGQPSDPEVDTLQASLLPGDRYLFCTDGIDKVITEPELEDMLRNGNDPQHILTSLIERANDRGGADNATGVLIFAE